jgi:DNA-binding transcriptional ArsR family regulator
MVFASPMAARKPGPPVTFYRLSSAAPSDQPDRHDDCVVALRALGESTRARIVGMLIEEPLDVGEISKRVGISQYNTSKHLRILREAGLLEVEPQGRRRLYALPDAIRQRAAERGVLDLGCCSFQFDQPVAATDLASGPPRKRSVGRPRRIAR